MHPDLLKYLYYSNMQSKAWNQYSSSSDSDVEDNDNDSWFDDDKQENSKTPQTTNNHPEKEQTNKVQESSQQAISQETKPQVQQKKADSIEKKYEKKKFLTDQELLNLYLSKQVDNTRTIKAANVRSEEARQIIKDLKTKRTVQIKQNAFILIFETEEDLINFIKLKIENRSRFYLQQYIENKNKKNEREERLKNSDNNERRPRRERPEQSKPAENKRDRPQRKERLQNQTEEKKQLIEKRPKKRYQKQQDSASQQKKQSRGLEQKKQKKNIQKEQQKSKKVYLPKLHFQIPQRSNNLVISSDSFDIQRVLEELDKKRVLKDFSKIYIEAPFYALKKVSLLCQEISNKKKFYLQKEPPLESEKDTTVKLTLIENLKKHYTDTFVDRFKPKVQVPQESHLRLLGEKSEEYFKNIDKYNVSELVKGFDQNKYIIMLKEASQNIQKLWNCWKIQAEEDYIEVLLRLTHRIKKSTIYDLQLKPSIRNDKALLTAELKQRPQKERRPKVDVSNVNNYLS